VIDKLLDKKTRRRVSDVLDQVPGGKPALRRARRLRANRLIRARGLFDAGWYERQAGRRFHSEAAALRDYLSGGRARGLSPHPLFEPEWYREQDWATRRSDPLLYFLARPRQKLSFATHVLFDPVRYRTSHQRARSHPAGSLGHFLEHAGPDTPLPLDHILGRPATVGWGAARRALEQATDTWREQERLRRAPRHVKDFDRDAERAFLHRFAGAAPVAGPPGDSPDGPLVTVVMPVWNRSGQLRAAVESVQAQSYGGWELVVVDDGSTDDTPNVLEGLGRFDSRIRVLRQEQAGVSAARNAAIRQARGRYVAFLDSDNTWEPDFLRLVLAAMTRDDLPAAYSAMELHHGEGQSRKVSYRAFGGGREFLVVGNHIDLNVLVVRTDLLRATGGFSTDLRRTVDYDLVLRLSERTELHYLPFIGAIYTEDATDETRISVREPLSWDYVVRSRHGIDWAAARSVPRVPGRTSVVLVSRDDPKYVRRCLASLFADGAAEADGGDPSRPAADLEVVIVDNASRRSNSVSLAAMALAHPGIQVHRNPVDVGFALGVNTGLVRTTGDVVVVVGDPSVTVPEGWTARLRAALQRPGVGSVQPVVTGRLGTIEAAGVTFPLGGALPVPLFEGNPVDDVEVLGEQVAVPALSGPVFAARAGDLLELGGLDCLYLDSWHAADTSLRLERAGHGGPRLVPGVEVFRFPAVSEQATTSRFTRDDEIFRDRWGGSLVPDGAQLWRGSGLDLVHTVVERDAALGHRRGRPVVVRRQRTVADGPAAGQPSLRWSIKIAAPAGPQRDRWGDWHFARSLAGALRRLGQSAVVDLRESAYRETGHVDDVMLLLRGLDEVEPDETRINLLWVISHPDQLTAAEAGRYDRVLGASLSWSQRVSREWGLPVEALLQCTDAQRFHPDAARPDSGAPVLFVGNSRGFYRPALRHAIEAGAEVHVYGGGWDPFLPDGTVKAPTLSNEALPHAYAAAGVVLNDHWDDMRLEGFLSNRLFDVAAVAGRVLSDEVEGIGEIFRGAVRTWTDPLDVKDLLLAAPEEIFAPREHRLAVAEAVRAEHSFDARARRLLDIALEVRSSR
jgi:glycosyltransferase involved in cell wall biosynthesis